jgi:hypothetical protein
VGSSHSDIFSRSFPLFLDNLFVNLCSDVFRGKVTYWCVAGMHINL